MQYLLLFQLYQKLQCPVFRKIGFKKNVTRLDTGQCSTLVRYSFMLMFCSKAAFCAQLLLIFFDFSIFSQLKFKEVAANNSF